MLRKILLCTLIVASVLWTAFIFSNSFANAKESSEQSSNVTEVVNKVTAAVGIDEKIPEATVRNMAHFSEFAVLAVLLSATVATAVWGKMSKNLPMALLWISASLPACFLLACIDELLQKFSEGRASDFADVLLDTLGALCGLAVFSVFYIIFTAVINKKLSKTD